MERPRFSEMLVQRRHELGLSTAQAAQVLKIKEQVLVAFEQGDFESIPKSGYAQGMLSSYARYLGLNARQLVDVFQEELYEYVNGQQSHELRRRTRNVSSGRDLEGYETVNEAQSRPKAYMGAKGLLPTSGGPAGDYGEFATTSKASPRSGSVQLVNSSRTTSLYATGNASYARGATYSPNDTAAVGSHSQFVNGYSNNARGGDRKNGGTRRQGSAAPQARRRRSDASRRASAAQGYDGLRRENVRTRRNVADEREEGRVESYEPATSPEARRRARSSNQQAPARPNVRRDQQRSYRGSSQRDDGRRRRQPQGRGSRSRASSTGGRGLGLGLVLVLVVAVILTVTLIVSVQSCTSSRDEAQPTSVPVTTTTGSVDTGTSSSSSASDDDDATTTATSSSSSEADSSSDDEDTDASASAGSDDASSSADTIELEVSVESGERAWVEVTVDGESKVADRYTGPWSATYTVTDSATVQADNTGAVTVTADGVTQTFSSKTSGVGSLTIEVPKSESEDEANAESGVETGSTASDTATTSTETTTTTQ